MTKTNNVLYFEGAGMDFHEREKESSLSDVGNFRIRTSFKNLDGRQIYLELGDGQELGKGNKLKRMFLVVDFAFYVPADKEQKINYYEIDKVHNKKEHLETRKLNYTKENITNWINEKLNCNFDTIEILNQFHGYHVHAGNQTYNLMEEININHKQAETRETAYNGIVENYSKLFNRKYPAISIKEMKDNYIIVDNHQGEELLRKYNLPSRYEKVLI